MATFAKLIPGGREGPRSPSAVKGSADDLLPLARMAAEGDPDAAATLVVHVAGPMLKVVRKVLGPQHADVDDVAQEAVMSLLQALATFRGECTVAHFANRVALLAALTASRQGKTQKRQSLAPHEAVENLPDDLPSPLATALAARRHEMVRNLLNDLPEVIAESLAMHFVLGYTVDEIAVAIAVSPSTVWSRLREGKRALRRRLAVDSNLAELLEEPQQ